MNRSEKTKLTKDKIKHAAIGEFGSKGFALASINNVCNAGIAKGLIYHNYENKNALYLECLQQCFDNMTAQLSETVDKGSYLSYIHARCRFDEENRFQSNMISEALMHPAEYLKEEIKACRKGYDDLNLAIFERILDAKTLRKGVDREKAIQYFSMMQDMFNWYYFKDDEEHRTLDDLARMHEEKLPQMIEYILYGIVKEEDMQC